MAVVIATGVNPEGRREVLGFDVVPAETEEGWTAFFKSLKERGLSGVKLVISDAHKGLVGAARKVLKAEWQRCKVHFYRNVLVHIDCGAKPAIAGLCQPCYARRRHSRLYFSGVREKVLERDGHQCRGCGAGNHRRPGVHEIEWLVTLCPGCHAVIHKLRAHRRWLPVPLLELWREQHPAVPLQLQLGIDEDRQGREWAA